MWVAYAPALPLKISVYGQAIVRIVGKTGKAGFDKYWNDSSGLQEQNMGTRQHSLAAPHVPSDPFLCGLLFAATAVLGRLFPALACASLLALALALAWRLVGTLNQVRADVSGVRATLIVAVLTLLRCRRNGQQGKNKDC